MHSSIYLFYFPISFSMWFFLSDLYSLDIFIAFAFVVGLLAASFLLVYKMYTLFPQ